ncbi:MAG: hypothetical protein WBC71_07870, partial [Salaquimonas sp.]
MVLAQSLNVQPDQLADDLMTFDVPFTHRKRGVETRLITHHGKANLDPVLIKTLARSHQWLKEVRRGETLAAIAKDNQHSLSYVRTRLQMALLSPKIQTAILDGTQPPTMSVETIARMT